MAEWLGRGLQNLVQRFESASDLRTLQSRRLEKVVCFVLEFVCERAPDQPPKQSKPFGFCSAKRYSALLTLICGCGDNCVYCSRLALRR